MTWSAWTRFWASGSTFDIDFPSPPPALRPYIELLTISTESGVLSKQKEANRNVPLGRQVSPASAG